MRKNYFSKDTNASNFPNSKIVVLDNVSQAAPAQAFAQNRIDALIWSQAQTQVWVLGHPEYASVSPEDVEAPFLMGYMVNGHSPQFLAFLNYWLELHNKTDFQKDLYNKWILAMPMQDNTAHWSILRNVLHWVS